MMKAICNTLQSENEFVVHVDVEASIGNLNL